MIMKQTKPAGSRECPPGGLFPCCRAKAIAFAPDHAECLAMPPAHCNYRLMAGWSYHCFHPRWREIVQMTGPAKEGS
jgi:hypothetical protein